MGRVEAAEGEEEWERVQETKRAQNARDMERTDRNGEARCVELEEGRRTWIGKMQRARAEMEKWAERRIRRRCAALVSKYRLVHGRICAETMRGAGAQEGRGRKFRPERAGGTHGGKEGQCINMGGGRGTRRRGDYGGREQCAKQGARSGADC